MALPAPGSVSARDCRKRGTAITCDRPLKLLQWNIERGYQLPGIIEELKRIDADVISLQEVDVGCERSGSLDTGIAIAEALQLNYLFLCEFEELHSPLRDARSQGGGVHGNAILTKLDVLDYGVVEHRMHPVDWNNPEHPLAKKEPRRGRRAVLRTTLGTPQGPLVVYCAHLEVFCGTLARVCQLADIFQDARALVRQGFMHQAILGDLNTMAHGIARLSPNYCCDRMRFRSIGMDEAVVWERYVLSVPDPAFDPSRDAQWAEQLAMGAGPPLAAPCPVGGASMEGEAAAEAAKGEQPVALIGSQGASPSSAAAAAQDAAADGALLAEELRQDLAAAAAPAAASHPSIQGAAPGVAMLVVAGDEPAAGAAQQAAAAAAGQAAGALVGASVEQGGAGAMLAREPELAGARPYNAQLVKWGLSMETASEALNPGFADPFPAATTVTLDNPAYRWFGVSLMRGKLDWALLRLLRVGATALGNERYQLSDHKWMAVEVSLDGALSRH